MKFLKNLNIFYFLHLELLFIFNFLVLSEWNLSFVGPALISGYLVSIPGFLFWNIIRKNINITWEDIVYSVGLSIATLMLGGLLLNNVSLLISYTTPLTKIPLLFLVNIIVLLLIFLNFIFRKNKKREPLNLDANVDKLKVVNSVILLIIVTFLPFLSIIGTSLLNNGGPNTFILLNLITICFLILFIGLFHSKLMDSLYPYTMLMIAITILLNISLRTWHINGTDIMTEFRMFQTSLINSYWSMDLQKHTYNACLSITILPVIFEKLTNINSEYIFKFLMQIIFAFTPVIVFLYTKKFMTPVNSFLAGILYISFPIFIGSMSMHIRQEIAFLFFSLLVYSLFNKSLNGLSKAIILLIFGFSMIVSHYSTTYICLALFILWFMINKFLYLISLKSRNFKTIFSKSQIPLWFLVSLILISSYWYVYIVSINTQVISIGSKILSNLSLTMSNDTRMDQTSLLNQFNIHYKQSDKNKLLNDYYEKIRSLPIKDTKFYYPPESYKEYHPFYIPVTVTPLNIPSNAFLAIVYFMETIKKLLKIFILIGVLTLLIQNYKKISSGIVKNNKYKDYLLLSSIGLFLLFLFTVLPYITIEYDALRTTQQLLLILLYPAIIGCELLLSHKLINHYKTLIVSGFIIFYFSTYTGIINYFTGGFPSSFILTNGIESERYVVSGEEIESARWLESHKINYKLIHSDPDSVSRINMSTISKMNLNQLIMPSRVYKDSYIYLNKFNLHKGVTHSSYNGEYMRFTIPIWFYENYKDSIYNNGGSKIYH